MTSRSPPPASGSTPSRPPPPAGVPTTARLSVLSGYGDHAGRYAHVLRWFAARGVAAAAVSFRGHGRSTGRLAHCRRWDDYLADADAFLATPTPPPGTPGEGRGEGGLESPTAAVVPTHPNPLPHFVLGHSHGGLVAAAMAQRGLLPGVAGVILSAPFFALALPVPRGRRLLAAALSRTLPWLPLRSHLTPDLLTRDPDMAAPDPLCPGVATPGWFAATTAARAAVVAAARSFTAPLLMLLPGDDRVVDPAAAAAFFDRCSSPDKAIRRYPDARHELLRDLGREAVLADVLQWMTVRAAGRPPQ